MVNSQIMCRLFLTVVLALSLTACGKKGALIYPDMLLPAAPAATSVSQIGSGVKLQFVLPASDRGGRRLHDLAGVKINKRKGMSDEVLFLKLYLDQLPDSVQRYGNRLFMFDSAVDTGKSYSYRVVPFTKGELDGSASPPASVLLVQPTLPPVLHAESFPTEIKVSFDTRPPTVGRFIGYNLYRTTQQGVVPPLPVNREPLADKMYIDSILERNVRYLYMARTVEQLEAGGIVESPPSNVVEGILKNDE